MTTDKKNERTCIFNTGNDNRHKTSPVVSLIQTDTNKQSCIFNTGNDNRNKTSRAVSLIQEMTTHTKQAELYL